MGLWHSIDLSLGIETLHQQLVYCHYFVPHIQTIYRKGRSALTSLTLNVCHWNLNQNNYRYRDWMANRPTANSGSLPERKKARFSGDWRTGTICFSRTVTPRKNRIKYNGMFISNWKGKIWKGTNRALILGAFDVILMSTLIFGVRRAQLVGSNSNFAMNGQRRLVASRRR